MLGLKKFIPNIRLGKEKQSKKSVAEEQPALHRANAVLRKRNKSSINIGGGLDIGHGSLPFSDGLQYSRQNSFEPDQRVESFEAERHAYDPRSNREAFVLRKPLSGGERSFLSTLGSTVATTTAQVGALGALSTSDLPLRHGQPSGHIQRDPILIRDGLEGYPFRLAPPSIDDVSGEAHRRQPIPNGQYRRTWNGKTWVELRNSISTIDEDDEPNAAELAFREAQHETRSKCLGKDKIPAIRDLDWSTMTEEEVQEIAKTYGGCITSGRDDRSPTDSAIALQGEDPAQSSTAKGKGRASRQGGQSDDASEAIDAWLAAETQFGQGHQRIRFESHPIHGSTRVGNQDRKSEEELQLLEIKREIREEHEHQVRVEEILEQLRLAAQEQLSKEEEEEEEEEDRIQAERVQEQLRKEQEEQDRIRAQQIQEQLRREQEVEELLAAERARLRECAVCGDTKDLDEYPAKTPTARCTHPKATCAECLQTWMASEFETKGCDGIKCPECPETLEYSDVQAVATPETFEAYDKLATRNALGALEEFAWCLKAGCGSGQENIENKHYMDCVNCGYKQCLKHRVPWHTGETCGQYEKRTSAEKAREEEKKTEAMLDTLSKKCPGPNCGWRIQKTDGCEHMTCKKCKFEFCWICLASHKEIKRVGNTAHASTCKFHSHNLDLAWPFNRH